MVTCQRTAINVAMLQLRTKSLRFRTDYACIGSQSAAIALTRCFSDRKRPRELSPKQRALKEEKHLKYVAKKQQRQRNKLIDRLGLRELINPPNETIISPSDENQDTFSSQYMFRKESLMYQIYGPVARDSFQTEDTVSFPGAIHVIEDQDQEQLHLHKILNAKLVGVDTEQKPKFSPGPENPVCLIQVATDSDALLYRIAPEGKVPAGLQYMLSNPDIIKVGQGIKGDLKQLYIDGAMSGEVNSTLDTMLIAKAIGCRQPGLKTLCELFLGKTISKKMQKSNWEATTLSEAQELYAATDAWAVRKVMISMLLLDERVLKKSSVRNYFTTERSPIRSEDVGSSANVMLLLEEVIQEEIQKRLNSSSNFDSISESESESKSQHH